MPRAAAALTSWQPVLKTICTRLLALVFITGSVMVVAALCWSQAYRRLPDLHLEAQRYVKNNKTQFAEAVRTRLGIGHTFKLGLDVKPARAALCEVQILRNQRCLPLMVILNSAYDREAFDALRKLAANPCALLGASSPRDVHLYCDLPPSERPVVVFEEVHRP